MLSTHFISACAMYECAVCVCVFFLCVCVCVCVLRTSWVLNYYNSTCVYGQWKVE